MQVEVCGNKYTIHFKHLTGVPSEVSDVGTMCVIHQGDCIECSGVYLEAQMFGRSYLSPKDNYSKSAGRKLSLGRALLRNPDKDFRKAFWTAYLDGREKLAGERLP